jgi:hypothetical protein
MTQQAMGGLSWLSAVCWVKPTQTSACLASTLHGQQSVMVVMGND